MFRIGIHHTRTLIDRNSHWDRHRHESTIVCCRSCSWHCARHRARCRVRRANLGIFRYRARAHEPAAPRHVTFMSGEQLLLLGSPQDHRLYNSDAQPLVFVELRCPLDGDVPATDPELKGGGVPLASRRGCSRAATTKKRADLGSWVAGI